jgi:thioredoxin-dependent peroxiredoxin
MYTRTFSLFFGVLCLLIMVGCGAKQPPPPIDTNSSRPGSEVSRKGEKFALLGTGIEVGQKLPESALVDAATMHNVNLSDYQGSILLLSMVPSIDTKVCEEQTHYLGEEGDALPASIKRITISRDTPFAQARFAKEAKLEDIQYLSDYKEGAFGRSIGLLIDGPRLLARAVILVDKTGVVRYIQVVPDITHLPDMDAAFIRATALEKQP